MGKKKPMEKSREWEKQRRNKLNVSFGELSKLLPEHDPAISLSKMDILKKAANFIRQLQKQNEEVYCNNYELKNEAQRFKERVAHLILKTNALVEALQAACIPLPNEYKKRRVKVRHGMIDQNSVPTTSVINSVQPLLISQTHHDNKVIHRCDKITSGNITTITSAVKNTCSSKMLKKNPLGENRDNVVIPPSNTVSVIDNSSVTCNLPRSEQMNTSTILNPTLAANLHGPAVYPSAFIIRKGRVITVPSILVRPQPTVILMQSENAQPSLVSCDKQSNLLIRRREVTQTTYTNKAPIPAIKAFRMESYPRDKLKAKKKKENRTESTLSSSDPLPVTTSQLTIKVPASANRNSVAAPSCNNQKRKAVATRGRSKVSKHHEQPALKVVSATGQSKLLKKKNSDYSSQKGVVEKPGARNIVDLVVEQTLIASEAPKSMSHALRQTLRESSEDSVEGVTGALESSTNIMDMEIALDESGITITEKVEDMIKKQSCLADVGPSNCSSTISNEQETWMCARELQESGKQTHIACSTQEKTCLGKAGETSGGLSPAENANFALCEQRRASQDQDNSRKKLGTDKIHVEIQKQPPTIQDNLDIRNQQFHPVLAGASLKRIIELDERGAHCKDKCKITTPAIGTESSPINKNLTQSEVKPIANSSTSTLKSSNPFLHDNNPLLYLESNNQNVQWPSGSGYDFSHPMVPVVNAVSCSASVNGNLSVDVQQNPIATCSTRTAKNDVCVVPISPQSTLASITCQVAGILQDSTNLTKDARGSSVEAKNSSAQVEVTCTRHPTKESLTTSVPSISTVPCEKSTHVDSSFPSTYAYSLSNSIYSISLPTISHDPARQESFFNYENPIANLPSADPYFPSLVGKTTDNLPAHCPNTCVSSSTFNYSYVSQPSNTRKSVARQFYTDSLCTVANSLLNDRLSQTEVPILPPPPISSNPTQVFHVGSYSNVTSFRNPLFLPNDSSIPAISKSNCASQFTSGTSPDTSELFGQSPLLKESQSHKARGIPLSSTPNNLDNSRTNITAPSCSSRSYKQNDLLSYYSAQTPCALNPFKSSHASSIVGYQKPTNTYHNRSANFSMNVITSNSGSIQNTNVGFANGNVRENFNVDSVSNVAALHLETSKAITIQPIVKLTEQSKTSPDSSLQKSNIDDSQYSHFQFFKTSASSIEAQKNYNGNSNDRNAPSPSSQSKTAHELTTLTPLLNVHSSTHAASDREGCKESNTSKLELISTGKSSNQFYLEPLMSPTRKSQYFRDDTLENENLPKVVPTQVSNPSSNSQGVQTHLSYVLNSNARKGSSSHRSSTDAMLTPSNSLANLTNYTLEVNQNSSGFPLEMSNSDQPCAALGQQLAQKPNTSRSCNSLSLTKNKVQNTCTQKNYNSILNTSVSLAPNKIGKIAMDNKLQSVPRPSSLGSTAPNSMCNSYSYSSTTIVPHSVYSTPTSVVVGQDLNFSVDCSTALASDFSTNQNGLTGGIISIANNITSSSNGGIARNSASSSQFLPNVEKVFHQMHRPEALDAIQKFRITNSEHLGNAQHPNIQSNIAHSAQSNGPVSTSLVNHSSNSKKPHHTVNNFSMSHIATCSSTHSTEPSSHFVSGIPRESIVTGISPRIANMPGQDYQSLSKQNSFKPSTSHSMFVMSDGHSLPVSKSYDFPLASILTGLNDPILSSSMVSNEVNLSLQSRNNSDPAQSFKHVKCLGKDIERHFIGNADGNSFKASDSACGVDFQQRSKDVERNSFIPIIEDVRLNSEFSNDLFSSLQVPTGGTQSDSISPTAAFLLAFPLVSTSKNSENPNEQEQQDTTHGTTPTTILQIGNIDPPNSELFHPLEFSKDIEGSDYLAQIQEKIKRKELGIAEKQKKTNINYPSTSTYSCTTVQPNDFNLVQFDQTWNSGTVDAGTQDKKQSPQERRKVDKLTKQINSSNMTGNFDYCKSDKKKKNKISVNWMATTEVSESFHKDVESSFSASTLSFPIDMDGFPDLCVNKKSSSNNFTTATYNWSPSKSLLPFDSTLVIPSTLPTLMGDLALGTLTPSDPYSKRVDPKKNPDKPFMERQDNVQKTQNNFLSVSQLVDPKSKKLKPPDTRGKKLEKKKATLVSQRRKDSNGEMNADNPPMGWEKYRHRNNYSAEALIGGQDVIDPVGYSSYQQQQSTNSYFIGSEFTNQSDTQGQLLLAGQYQSNFTLHNQYPPYSTDNSQQQQSENFSLNQQQQVTATRQPPTSKQSIESHSHLGKRVTAGSTDKRTGGQCFDSVSYLNSRSMRSTYFQQDHQHPSSLGLVQPPSSGPITYTSNTTTSVTNFNLSTIFPEINERTRPQSQRNNQTQPSASTQQHQVINVQQCHNGVDSCTNVSNTYRNI